MVAGILLIVFGSISVILALISLAASSFIIGVLELICGACGIVVGVFGIKNRGLPEKAQQCLLLDIILMVLLVGRAIYSVTVSLGALNQVSSYSSVDSGALFAGSAIGVIIGVIITFTIPVLYLIGAIMNKKAFTQLSQYPNQPYPNQQYPNQQYPNQQYPNQQYPNQQYPNQQYPNQQYPNQQYPNQQYPNQQYPNQQYPNP